MLPKKAGLIVFSLLILFITLFIFYGKNVHAQTITLSPAPGSLPGDFDGDGQVNISDFNKVVSFFGNPYTIFDFNLVITNFGKSVTPTITPTNSQDPLLNTISHNFQFASSQLTNTANTVSFTNYPIYTTSTGAWSTTGASTWTSGFFPGDLWLMYERTGDPAWRTKAENWTNGLESQKNNTSTHDIGFIIFSSFGNGYRLTGNSTYKQIVLTAANSLATRYNATVGCIRSWNSTAPSFQVIIDNMMNLEILFWAAKNGGPSSLRDIAINHALKTSQNHVRADGSTYQLVVYNQDTGEVISRGTRQGYNNESTWSRGQAWAIHGFTMAYRETGDIRFLETARKTADFFISHLPDDFVPYWDLELPDLTNQPRDSSAASIAASGLLELSRLESDNARKLTYRTSAKNILQSLSSAAYLAEGTTNKALLLHGTYNKVAGNYNTGLIWGDYYFLQGMLRYH